MLPEPEPEPTPPEDIPLADLLADPTHEFPVLSASRRSDHRAGAVSIADSEIVHSIASDGNGGFVVTYTTPEQGPRVVEFDTATFDPDNEGRDRYDLESVDGFGRLLWSQTGAFNDGPSNAGSPQFDYLDVSGFSAFGGGAGYRSYLVYGVETQAVPMAGTATYAGRMAGQMYFQDDPAAATSQHQIRGSLALVADFGAGTIGGSVDSVRIRPPGMDEFQNDPMTISIGASPIRDGGFAGSWSEDSAGGFSGEVEARFFGPAANEVGGVMSGTDPGEGLVLIGYIAGKK